MKAGAVASRCVSGGVQVAIWFGAFELGWKMTRVVARHRTLSRRVSGQHAGETLTTETTSSPPRQEGA
jgi:hypothetical protein